MGQSLWSARVTSVGESVADLMAENMIITFREPVPPELQEICVLIDDDHAAVPDIVPGSFIEFAGVSYRVTAVGDLACKNLRQLGHAAFKFDGATVVEMPGEIHVEAGRCPQLNVGDVLRIVA